MKHTTFGTSFRGKTAHYARLDDLLDLCNEFFVVLFMETAADFIESGVSPTDFDINYRIKDVKKAHPEFYKVPSNTLQSIGKRVGKEIRAIIAKGNEDGWYRFHTETVLTSMEFPNPDLIVIEGNTVILPKMKDLGPMRFRYHGRPLPEFGLKMCIVKKRKKFWYGDFIYAYEETVTERPEDDRTAVGIDLGLKTLVTASDGETYEHIRFMKDSKEIAKIQRRMAKYDPGTPEREKYRQYLENRFKHIADRRLNHLRHVAKSLVERYAYIAMEDIDVKKLILNEEYKGIRRSQHSAAWGILDRALALAAAKAGTVIQKVDPRMTSQMCSGCGRIVKKDLSERMHRCPHCGLEIDRDLNASINILAAGEAAAPSRCRSWDITGRHISKTTNTVV